MHLSKTSLHTAIDSQGLRISDALDGQTLLYSPGGFPLLPVIDGVPVAAEYLAESQASDTTQFTLKPASGSPVEDMVLFMEAGEQYVDFWCTFRAKQSCELNALSILPVRSGINMYDVVNFRNRHFTAATWPELSIGREFQTSTYSNDWQFAPHPTALLLRKNEAALFVGFMDLQATFGMRLEVKQSVVSRWDVDFGDASHGWKLMAGETFCSGRLRIFLRHRKTPHELYAEFGTMFVHAGKIADPAAKKRYDWWSEPLYCTWGDQWMLANARPPVELQEQANGSADPASDLLTEAFVRKAVSVIQKESLPIRTILLDEGWAVARGDWRPHPQRFPNMRGLVDELHQAGFKVMVWWNWAEIAKNAQVDPRYLVEGGAWRNKHGSQWRDYSDPTTQEEYFKPLLRTLFSSEPGCLDLDGVKTDFLADKVHPETPVADPCWRGEERYFQKITDFFYQEMRRYKPDAMHMGCAGNYWLAEFIDTNRTYDVHSSDWMEHEERAKMLACTSPGAILSYDMMAGENIRQWFDSAARMGAAVQIGHVMASRKDSFSPTQPPDAAYFELLRWGCSLTGTAFLK